MKVNWNNVGAYALAVLMFSLIIAMTLSGAVMLGAIELHPKLMAYLGAAMIGYVIVGSFVVSVITAKTLTKKG